MPDFTYLPVNLGCRLNQAELTKMELIFQAHGGVLDQDHPDLVIINTCGVTTKAEKESRQTIRQLRRRYPQAKLIAWGCAAQRWLSQSKSSWASLGLDAVYGNQDKDTHPIKFINLIKHPNKTQPVKTGFYTIRPRRFVKIQTGCDKFCSFCLIPFMRLRSRSKPPDRIIAEVKRAVKDGVKEVILTGVDISSYGLTSPIKPASWRSQDLMPLTHLLEQILAKTKIARIRLGSINPASFNPSFINLFKHHRRLMPHFHISLQSGSDRILKLMNRRYLVSDYIEIIHKLYDQVPDVLISTDIIAGFPTETEADFAATRQLVRRLNLSRLHVFPFSHRPGSLMDKLNLPPLPSKVIKTRAAKLRRIGQQLHLQAKQRYAGQPVKVLWESYRNGVLRGLTHNYLPATKKGSPNQVGQIEEIIYQPPV